ncbi:hypothetical protein SBV1_640020 [Verrucomicrobia bacterium]|nr:hypothetical protein SBV1_640020 [Verrucomicrobiota bacterium]
MIDPMASKQRWGYQRFMTPLNMAGGHLAHSWKSWHLR